MISSVLLAAAALAAGTYVIEGNGGELKLDAAKDGGFTFEMTTWGHAGHSCMASGQLAKGATHVVVRTENPSKLCGIGFKPTKDGVEVEVDDFEGCQPLCGMRAWLGGVYVKETPSCVAAKVQRARDAFKKSYDKKSYADAKKTLAPVLETCGRFLAAEDEGWVRNDLALTLHHLKDDKGCVATLKPLEELAAKTDDQIREDPTADEGDVRVAKATRTNLKLCQGLASGKR